MCPSWCSKTVESPVPVPAHWSAGGGLNSSETESSSPHRVTHSSLTCLIENAYISLKSGSLPMGSISSPM